MEVTIKLSDKQIKAMNLVGKDGGRLDYYVDGYYWGDTMADTESIIVQIHEEIKAKQQLLWVTVDVLILELLGQDWTTFDALYKRIKESKNANEVREGLSEDLVVSRCAMLAKEQKIIWELVNEDNDEFHICRKLPNPNGQR